MVPFGATADSGTVIEDVDDLIAYCLENPDEYQSISWHSIEDTPPRIAGMYFTEDGAMVSCLSSYEGEDKDNWLRKLKSFFDTDVGYIAYEIPSPSSGEEFRRICTSPE